MKLKSILTTIVLLFFANTAFAQSSKFRKERRIYLWDVTLSMKGYQDKTPDIYEQVVKTLVSDIKQIADPNTEICVLPFQEEILATWTAKADQAGKAKMISLIEDYNNEQVSYTNISDPMRYVMNNLIKDDKRNILILMTDGVQNSPRRSIQDLLGLIEHWCAFAQPRDAHAFYVMLTNAAQDRRVLETLDRSCRITGIVCDPENISINFTTLLLPQHINVNLKDEFNQELSCQLEAQKAIPEGLKLKLSIPQLDFVRLSEESRVVTLNSDGTFRIKLDYQGSYQNLKARLPQDSPTIIPLSISLVDADRHPMVQLLGKQISIKLINKAERTLKIYVK